MLKAVPYKMTAGLAQVRTGVRLLITKVPFPVAKSLALVDAFTEKDVVPAGVDEVVDIVNVDPLEVWLGVKDTGFGEKEALAPAGKADGMLRIAGKFHEEPEPLPRFTVDV